MREKNINYMGCQILVETYIKNLLMILINLVAG